MAREIVTGVHVIITFTEIRNAEMAYHISYSQCVVGKEEKEKEKEEGKEKEEKEEKEKEKEKEEKEEGKGNGKGKGKGKKTYTKSHLLSKIEDLPKASG